MSINDWLRGYTEDFGFDQLADKLGEEAMYVTVDGLTTVTLNVVFNEFVGAIDEKGRALFSISEADVAIPRRGDRLTLSGKVWYVVDFRTDEAGLHELRCDISQADV